MTSNANTIKSIHLYKQKSNFLTWIHVAPFLVLYVLLAIALANASFSSNPIFAMIHISNFALSMTKTMAVTISFIVILIFQLLLFLCTIWNPHLHCLFTMNSASPKTADFVYVKAKFHCGCDELSPLKPVTWDNSKYSKCFTFQRIKYILDKDGNFTRISYPTKLPLQSYMKLLDDTHDDANNNADDGSAPNLLAKYGRNFFEIPDITFLKIYKEHITAPFFVFQILIIVLWSMDGYFGYSMFTILMLFSFEAAMAQKRLKNLDQVRKMRFPATKIFARRNNVWVKVSTFDLLPNDIVSIQSSKNITAPCDILLLKGQCVINEALLTGESIPQIKDSLENSMENPNEKNTPLDIAVKHRRHLISGGTFILSSTNENKFHRTPDGGAVGVVVQTSFATNQGKLLRTILYSTEKSSLSFDSEALWFILLLVAFSLLVALYVFFTGIQKENVDIKDLLLNCAMIVTMVIPTELPMILSLTINNSLAELAKLNIFCSEGFRVPLAGSLSHCCFDKTGTLTRNQFTVSGICSAFDSSLKTPLITPPSKFNSKVKTVIGGCHSISIINNEMVGDALELAALNSIQWKLGSATTIHDSSDKLAIKIVKRFPFSSTAKRMSCVVQVQKELVYTMKGASEVVQNFLKKIPANYSKMNSLLSKKGFRVIALAHRTLESSKMKFNGSELDKEMIFDGFLLFKSPPNAYAIETIKELHSSLHHTIMITGDNILTANHVSQEVGLCSSEAILYLDLDVDYEGEIKDNVKNSNSEEQMEKLVWRLKSDDAEEDSVIAKFSRDERETMILSKKYHLSISGSIFSLLSQVMKEEFDSLIAHFKIFARMTPFQKEHIIRCFKKDGINVLMCGDGTNDVGALKQAHIGVALSEAKDSNKKADEATCDENIARDGKKKSNKIKMKKKKNFLKKIQKEMEDEDSLHIDMNVASIASPFTSRSGSLESILDIIRQGRRTLIINQQMYQILALNCLIYTFMYSYSYLKDMKLSDSQATLSEMLISVLFLFVSSANPLKTISKRRPRKKVLSAFLFCNLIGQLCIHFVVLFAMDRFLLGSNSVVTGLNSPSMGVIKTASMALSSVGKEEMNMTMNSSQWEKEEKFVPSVGNTVMFYLGIIMNLATFVSNYIGHPYVESIKENKKFSKAIAFTVGFLVVTVGGYLTDLLQYMELIDISLLPSYGLIIGIFIADFVLIMAYERLMRKCFSIASN